MRRECDLPLPAGVEASDGCFAVLNNFEGFLACNDDTQTRRSTETLLAGTNNHIDVPVIETDLFTRD